MYLGLDIGNEDPLESTWAHCIVLAKLVDNLGYIVRFIQGMRGLGSRALLGLNWFKFVLLLPIIIWVNISIWSYTSLRGAFRF